MSRYLFGLVAGLLLLVGPLPLAAQAPARQAVTLKHFAFSYHLKQARNPELFLHRIDQRGIGVLHYGLIAGYDRYVYKDVLFLRAEKGLYADCAASLAGFWHLGWRALILRKGRHSLNGGIGPTLVFRRNWNRLPGYTDDGYFRRHGDWQYRFFLYAGELEYNYQIKGRSAISLTLIPGLPELVSFGVGFRRHW